MVLPTQRSQKQGKPLVCVPSEKRESFALFSSLSIYSLLEGHKLENCAWGYLKRFSLFREKLMQTNSFNSDQNQRNNKRFQQFKFIL